MGRSVNCVRQALFAVLFLIPAYSFAQVSAEYEKARGEIIVNGLTAAQRELVLEQPDRLLLQVMGSESVRGMLIDLSADINRLVVSPRFRLKAGATYNLQLSFPGAEVLSETI